MRHGFVRHMDCAHHLDGHGLCESRHGHTYRVEAAFEAPPGPAEKDLEAALSLFDHRDLNTLMDFPTCERLLLALKGEIVKTRPNLCFLKVWEGEGKWAEWRALMT